MKDNFRPRQSLGQNFLQDPNTARKIAALVRADAGDTVVEIGAGTGAMTGHLLERYPDLVAFEIDERASAILRDRHPKLDVRTRDILDVDWEDVAGNTGKHLHVIGNLPYYLTSQILFSVLDSAHLFREAVFMMQLEVAQRLVAMPRTKAYGILSVRTQLVSRPSLLFRVSPNVFFPKPDVTSAMVRLEFGDEVGAARSVGDAAFLKRVIRTAFSKRRKVLRNSLAPVLEELQVELPAGLAGKRAEELDPQSYIALADHLLRESA